MSGERRQTTSDEIIEVPKKDLYELYSTLADATTAASTGDPNECSRLAAEAKRQVQWIYKENGHDG